MAINSDIQPHLPDKLYNLCQDKNFLNGRFKKRFPNKETDKEGDLTFYQVRLVLRTNIYGTFPVVERNFFYNNNTVIRISSLFRDKNITLDMCSDNHGYKKSFLFSEPPLSHIKNIKENAIGVIIQSIEDIFNAKALINHSMPRPE